MDDRFVLMCGLIGRGLGNCCSSEIVSLRLLHMERETIRKIRQAVRQGRLPEPFTAQEVHQTAGIPISTARTFLPKHRVGNPYGTSELFVRADRGRYRLTDMGLVKRQNRRLLLNDILHDVGHTGLS